jgi:integrase
VLVGDLLDALEGDLELQGKLSPQVKAHLKPIRAAFENSCAVAVTPERIDAYIQGRLASRQEGEEAIPGKAPSTVNRETQLLHQAFRLAVDRGRLAFLPRVRHLSEVGNVRRGFFERAEFDAVCEALPADLRDFARFGYITGWRKGEIAAMSWADVDGEAVRLRAEDSKNRRGRSVPLEGDLRDIIERRRAARQYENPAGTVALAALVFHRDGRPVGDFKKAWATACTAAGVSGRLFHDLRRSAARNLVRAGNPESVAMAVTGHKTRSIFQRYAIASERDIREALQKTQAFTAQEAGRATVIPVSAAKKRARAAG